MRLASFLCFLLLASFGSFGSDNDSLKVLLKKVREASYLDSTRLSNACKKAMAYAHQVKEEEEANAEICIYNGNYLFYKRNYEKAAQQYNNCLRISRQILSSHFEILAKIRLMYIDREYGLTQNTIEEAQALLNQCIKSGDHENEFELYNIIGIVYEENGDLKKAAEFYIKGLSKSELVNDEYFQGNFLNNLGLIKYYMGELDSADADFKKGIDIVKNTNYRRLLTYIKMNHCLVSVGKNRFDEVNTTFKEVLRYSVQNDLPIELANSYALLGSVYIEKNDLKKGLGYIDSAIYFFDKYHFNNEHASALLTKANVFLQMNDAKSSEKLVEEIEGLVLRSNNGSVRSKLFFLKYELCEKKQDHKCALYNYRKYVDLLDSIHREVNNRTIGELHLRYNIQKKAIELEKEKTRSVLLQKSYQEEVFLRWIIIGITLVLIASLVVFFYYRYYSTIRKQQAQFSKQLIINIEQERSRIAQDLHDDIGQSLSILKSKFNSNPKEQEDKIINKEIERVIEQTRQISKNLFPSYVAKVGLKTAIEGLTETLQKNSHLECSYELSNDTDAIPANIATHVYRIIQECLNNTIKHSQATALKIEITKKNDHYHLIYLDNGNWDTHQTKKSLGIGLLSIKEHAKIISGILSLHKNEPKGFKLILEF